MNDKEVIDIFERIWHADIINKTEPLYSVALSVVQRWSVTSDEIGPTNNPPLYKILLRRLLAHWEEVLTRHVDTQPVGVPLGTGVSVFFYDLRQKYKDSALITDIINKIARSITSGNVHEHPYREKHAQDPSCAHAHN